MALVASGVTADRIAAVTFTERAAIDLVDRVRKEVVAALARSALASGLVRRAADRPHWRKVYVGCPFGDGVLEGFVDLMYRDDDGLVVVDYKTDSWRADADLGSVP